MSTENRGTGRPQYANEQPEEYDYQNARNPPAPQGQGPSPQTGPNKAYVLIVEDEDDGYGGPNNDENDAELIKFAGRSRRMLFVRKVLMSVGLQFLVVTLAVALFMFVDPIGNFFRKGGILANAIIFLCLALWTVLFYAIACYKLGYGKPNPTNISLMVLSTLLLSVYTAGIVVSYEVISIMIAAATTVGVVLILSLITFNTKVDITSKGIYIMGAALALVLFSIIFSLVFAFAKAKIDTNAIFIISTILSALFAMLFAVMILHNLKLIVGGGKYQYGEDDWLLASISLFYDILLFFLQMLGILRNLS